MLRDRKRVSRDRLVIDEPMDLPDGSEIEWPAELDAELARRLDEAQRGNALTAEEVIARLRRRR